jgi:hypothetical protein
MIWRIIPDFPQYEASEKGGRIRNKRTKREISKWIHNGRRYSCYRVTLYPRNGKVSPRVGRLVASAFHRNDDPENKTQVDHLDTNPFNDDAVNLEWVTNLENQRRKKNRKGHNEYLIEKLNRINNS